MSEVKVKNLILWRCINYKTNKMYYFLEDKKTFSIFEVNENFEKNVYTHIFSSVRRFNAYCISNNKHFILKDETKRNEIFDDETNDNFIWCITNEFFKNLKYFIEYNNKIQEITQEQERNIKGKTYINTINNFDELYCYSLLKNKPIEFI